MMIMKSNWNERSIENAAGGEFSHIAGVTDEGTHVKQMLRHALTVPRATILDPWLSVLPSIALFMLVAGVQIYSQSFTAENDMSAEIVKAR